MMRVTLKLFATLGDYLPPGSKDNRVELDIDPADSLQLVLDRCQLPERLIHLVLINGVYIPPAERAGRCLEPGDQLAVWPPIAGG